MGEMMTFPASVEEFMEQYKMTDTEHVYSNGTEFVPIYRMKQWFEHVNYNGGSDVRHGRWLPQVVLGEKAWDCSECKTLGSPHWKWCPVCGAKMQGAENE